jgi:hypothetical protein
MRSNLDSHLLRSILLFLTHHKYHTSFDNPSIPSTLYFSMASTYDLLENDSDEERQKNQEGPPRENLLAAATYITLLLSANSIGYATMGGFAMICCCSIRNTSDVDVIVATGFNRLCDVLRQQPR